MGENFTQEYESLLYKLNCLKEEALYILNNEILKSKIKINKIESRVKSLDSLLGKVERKKIKHSILEISDIVGIRLVCLFLSDISTIKDIINCKFDVLEEDDKINGQAQNEFGYMSYHYIVKMKDEYCGPRYDDIKDIKFEIQIRTMAMDAWANISHYLDYKTDKDIPAELKRDFYALSGLFYVADKHFEIFYKSKENNIEQITESIKQEENYHQSINIDTLTAYLHTKMPNRDHCSPDIVSELVNELIIFGYQTLEQIDEMLNKAYDAFELYEKERPPYSVSQRFNDVGVVRISLEIVDEKYLEFIEGEYGGTDLKKYREMINS